jgi:hypothetical protein
VVATAGLATYAAGLAVALVPFVRTALRRPPHSAAAWMLGAGMAWLAVAVVADLGAVAASPTVADLEAHVARLVPVVVAGFALQTLTGASRTCCRWCSAAGRGATAAWAASSSWAGRCGWPPSTSGCWRWSPRRRCLGSWGGG